MRTFGSRFRRVLGAAVLFPVVALAVGACYCSPEKRIEKVASWLTDDLDLNESQRTKLDALVAEIVRVRKEHKAASPEKFAKIESLLKSDRLSADEIDTVIADKQKHFGQATTGVKERFIDFHASLNAQQKEKLVERLKKFRKHWES